MHLNHMKVGVQALYIHESGAHGAMRKKEPAAIDLIAPTPKKGPIWLVKALGF